MSRIAYLILVSIFLVVGIPYLAYIISWSVFHGYYVAKRQFGDRLRTKTNDDNQEQDLWPPDEKKERNDRSGV